MFAIMQIINKNLSREIIFADLVLMKPGLKWSPLTETPLNTNIRDTSSKAREYPHE